MGVWSSLSLSPVLSTTSSTSLSTSQPDQFMQILSPTTLQRSPERFTKLFLSTLNGGNKFDNTTMENESVDTNNVNKVLAQNLEIAGKSIQEILKLQCYITQNFLHQQQLLKRFNRNSDV